MITEKAPTRIDLAGGTLDIWPLSVMFAPSASINVAIDLYAVVEARENAKLGAPVITTGDGKITIYSPKTAEKKKTLFHRALDFIPVSGWEFSIKSSSPPGAGLGGSSSMLIAFLRALNRISGADFSIEEIMDAAKNMEARHLGIPTGLQDYVAALNGGVNALVNLKETRECRPLGISAVDVEKRVVLAYSGESRNSGVPNWLMFKRAVEREKATVSAFEKIAKNSLDVLSAITEGRLGRVGGLIDKEEKQRELLGRGVVTPAMRRVFAKVKKRGGHPKVCGAGGGGCFLVWCEPSRKDGIISTLEESGMRRLDFRVAAENPEKR